MNVQHMQHDERFNNIGVWYSAGIPNCISELVLQFINLNINP